MRKRDRKEFERYIRHIADEVELRDWSIGIIYEQPSSPKRQDGKRWGASSESTPGRKYVGLTFPPDCRGWDRDELRATVVHELIHAHLAPLAEMCREDLHGHIVESAYYLFNDSATRWLEYAVDALADALAKHQPLIEWPA